MDKIEEPCKVPGWPACAAEAAPAGSAAASSEEEEDDEEEEEEEEDRRGVADDRRRVRFLVTCTAALREMKLATSCTQMAIARCAMERPCSSGKPTDAKYWRSPLSKRAPGLPVGSSMAAGKKLRDMDTHRE